MTRPSWDDYFMSLAREASTRATCPRKKVGVVLVRDLTVLATGYNGSLRGLPHCDDVGCLMQDGHCTRTLHAETNAIVQAAREGIRLAGCVSYVTAFPCWPCFKQLANVGCTRIVFGEAYRDDLRVTAAAAALKIHFKHRPLVAPQEASGPEKPKKITLEEANALAASLLSAFGPDKPWLVAVGVEPDEQEGYVLTVRVDNKTGFPVFVPTTYRGAAVRVRPRERAKARAK